MTFFCEIDITDLEFFERIDSGAFGSVYRAQWTSKDTEVAVKKLLHLAEEVSTCTASSRHRKIMWIVFHMNHITIPVSRFERIDFAINSLLANQPVGSESECAISFEVQP